MSYGWLLGAFFQFIEGIRVFVVEEFGILFLAGLIIGLIVGRASHSMVGALKNIMLVFLVVILVVGVFVAFFRPSLASQYLPVPPAEEESEGDLGGSGLNESIDSDDGVTLGFNEGVTRTHLLSAGCV